MSTLLEVEGMSKIFGGLVAVNELDFTVDRGSVVGLIGPNGAGKTTVFNCITGNYVPERGDILFNGQSIRGRKPHTIVELGIARTFQTIRLFGHLSVLENVLAGRHCRLRSGFFSSMFRLPSQRREEQEAVERCMKELKFVGLEKFWREEGGSLAYGSQRLLEIARALASDPKLIILDEPAGGMNDQETEDLMRVIDAIRNRGITVLLIESTTCASSCRSARNWSCLSTGRSSPREPPPRCRRILRSSKPTSDPTTTRSTSHGPA